MEDLPFPFAVSPVPPGAATEADDLRAQLAAALKERCVHGTVPSERDLLTVQAERDALRAEVERLKERLQVEMAALRRMDFAAELEKVLVENVHLRAAIAPTAATLDAVVDVLDDAHFDKREKAERVLAAIDERAKGTP